MSVTILHTVAALRAQVARWRDARETVGLVPTMGALHAGHISLVHEARKQARRVVMSIFVNPTQFAPTEDFSAYPRTLAADTAKFAAVDGDCIFAPDVGEMYATGFAATVSLGGPATVGLEDRFRPTHFAGVATVVAKLLNQCGADVAVFGQKDYQQLRVITRMARDLDIATAIVGAPTVREADGLAMSSRNIYLTPEERLRAPRLHIALQEAADTIRAGGGISSAVARALEAVGLAGFEIDYIEARQADDLTPVETLSQAPVRLLAAAKLGATRLIDNVSV